MRAKLSFVLVLATLIAAWIHLPATAAVQGSNITIRPFLQNVAINPGDKSKKFELTIFNDSAFKQVFNLSTLNFGSLDETGGIAFQGADISRLANKYGLVDWLVLDKKELSLNANAQTSVNVTIKNDSGLSPGAHYAAIIVSASKPSAPTGQLTVTPKVSSLVFATKTGGATYDMHLESLNHNGKTWQLPTQVSTRFKSTGNTFIIPRGVVSLKQGDRVISRGAINEQSSLVLPETVRNFDVNLNKVSELDKGLLFTNYKIQLDYRYDGMARYASATYSYRLFNKVTLIGLAILPILIVIVFQLMRSPSFKKKINKMLRR